MDTLKNNEPEEPFRKEIDDKKDKVKGFLNESEGEFEATKEVFDFNVNKFKKAGKKNYDLLTKSGQKFQDAVYNLCQKMFRFETFPETFTETTLHMIWKAKGRQTNLDSNRFIHCKPWLPRAAESLIVEGGLKEPLLQGSSIYQIGGQPGHRSEELLFVMKSIIAKYRKMGKNIVLQLYDISKFFDKEMMEDAVLTCLKRKADPKAVRLWYKLNANTKIQVRTGVGLTKFGSVGAVVGQGMLGGALVSQAVLDEGVGEHFPPGGELQLEYGDVPLAPMMWLDDIINGAEGLEQARKINERINILMKQRGLSLNKDKSVCLFIGSKAQKKRATEELKSKPLMCGSFATQEKQEDKWLGQIISSSGLADSVAKTVEDKQGKIRGACLEICIIINDWRARNLGGMETALMLWETCCVPSLLHGAGTWVEINKATEKKLNALQLWFLRLVLRIGPGSPCAALLWDNQMLDMGLRVWIQKVLLVLHIRSLEEETLAFKIYKEQKTHFLPGLAQETEFICKELSIEDCNNTTLSKTDYKTLLLNACHSKNEERLRLMATETKCARITQEKYGKQKYFKNTTIEDTRNLFKTRFGLQKFAGNFTHDRQFSKTDWLCRCRNAIEEEGHIVSGSCEVYSDLRTQFGDLGEDRNLAEFFRAVLDRRDTLEEEDRKWQPLPATVVASSVPGNRNRTSQSGDFFLSD